MKNLRAVIMDVDGTLTDGKLYIGEGGELAKAFHVKDGYAIKQLVNSGVLAIVVTGRYSKIVENRCAELDVSHLMQNCTDKAAYLRQLAAEIGCNTQDFAYIGDDLNDLDAMQICGVIGCPADAVPEIRELADYICQADGGCGAVREFYRWLSDEGRL